MNFWLRFAITQITLILVPLFQTRIPQHLQAAAPEFVPLRDALNLLYPAQLYPAGQFGVLQGLEHTPLTPTPAPAPTPGK